MTASPSFLSPFRKFPPAPAPDRHSEPLSWWRLFLPKRTHLDGTRQSIDFFDGLIISSFYPSNPIPLIVTTLRRGIVHYSEVDDIEGNILTAPERAVTERASRGPGARIGNQPAPPLALERGERSAILAGGHAVSQWGSSPGSRDRSDPLPRTDGSSEPFGWPSACPCETLRWFLTSRLLPARPAVLSTAEAISHRSSRAFRTPGMIRRFTCPCRGRLLCNISFVGSHSSGRHLRRGNPRRRRRYSLATAPDADPGTHAGRGGRRRSVVLRIVAAPISSGPSSAREILGNYTRRSQPPRRTVPRR
jgi:hypothetical protein